MDHMERPSDLPPVPKRPPAAPTSEAAEALLAMGLVTRRHIQQALADAPGVPPEQALVDLGVVSAGEVADALALVRDLAVATDLESFPFDPGLLAPLPAPFAMRNQIVPLRLVGRRLVVAIAAGAPNSPAQTAVLERIATLTGHAVTAWPIEAERLRRACRMLYDPHSLRGAMARAMERGQPEHEVFAVDERQPTDAPIIDLVNDLLARAIEAGASDVHIAPLEHETIARFRVDGILRDELHIPAAIAPAVVTRLKLVAELNITERRHPQDGRFTITRGAQPIDVRIATTPTRWGELVVMRLLRPLALSEGLGDLGFMPADLTRFKRLAASPNGILLVTGPTGSGKSTTLFTALSSFDRVKRHVVTIEDPIEYSIDRVMQIQVNAPIGLTFAAALRSILRLDPNVILIGEIRDAETLEIAMHAAMTGHLVLSTLHANDALTTFPRMAELGATSRQIASCLLGVVAQRLMRRVCEGCARTYEPDADERELLGLATGAAASLRRGAGCQACGGTGYKGRIGVYEILALDDEIAQGLTDVVSIPTLRGLARESGMTTMWDDARAKALAGLTTVEELERVVRKA